MPNDMKHTPESLKASGFDGLYVPDGCACLLDDLEPCEEMRNECEPGVRLRNCGEHHFCIGPKELAIEDRVLASRANGPEGATTR